MGTLGPEIELWNVDVLHAGNPHGRLRGGGPSEDKKKKKKKNKKKADLGGHTDAVLGLSWNALQANVLASASADTSVRLWDLQQCQCSAVLGLHSAKVALSFLLSLPNVCRSNVCDGIRLRPRCWPREDSTAWPEWQT